ncbi:hypothetical protein JTB14_033376 [Gonioctena quinquepunctata]|nr:hypothetical protein JTB14_033376 [Gonioctena quinquepunctata]
MIADYQIAVKKITTSYSYKILISIKQLESQEKYRNSATLEDIEKFMLEKYCLIGDIRSELENALSVAIQSRFLVEKEKCYTSVYPAAKLQLIPESCVKETLEEIQESYSSVQRSDADSNAIRKRKCYTSVYAAAKLQVIPILC